MAMQPPSEHVAAELLARAHDPEIADRIFSDKVKKVPLLLKPTEPDPKLNARSKRQYDRLQKEKAQRRSKKPKPLSARQKRVLGVHDIPKEQQKYAIYEPLHSMWCAYIRDILGLSDGRNYVDANSAGPMLVSADYHGAHLEVVRSRCVSRVGLQGLVVKDTKFTFELITPNNQLKTVPKEHTVFRFNLPFASGGDQEGIGREKPLLFEIHGSQFQSRPQDRANKKFKMHIDPDL
jgi:ribonuclease P protein subunit POP4